MVKFKILVMTEEKLLTIINELLMDEGEDKLDFLDMSCDLKNDIGLDSIALAHLTVKIEDEYGVDIFADGLIKTIQEVYDKVNR